MACKNPAGGHVANMMEIKIEAVMRCAFQVLEWTEQEHMVALSDEGRDIFIVGFSMKVLIACQVWLGAVLYVSNRIYW